VASVGPDVSSLRALRRARDRIDRDYAEEVPIAALATEAGYSLGQFIRAFSAAYGETPGRYRTRRRVERACELLRSVNLTVTEVCMLVGFSSLGSFSRRFADVTGRSPSQYQRDAERAGGPAPIPGCFALMWRAGLPARDEAGAGLSASDETAAGLPWSDQAGAGSPASDRADRNFGEAKTSA
jgi:AraC-like DNA-binding protein